MVSYTDIQLVYSVSSSSFSNLVTIPPGPHLLSDLLATSPILAGEGGAGMAQGMDQDGDFGAAAGGEGGAGGDFGIDPNMDPELAMVSFGLRSAGQCIDSQTVFVR
jgi:26S proteasome regulatory subunit N10